MTMHVCRNAERLCQISIVMLAAWCRVNGTRCGMCRLQGRPAALGFHKCVPAHSVRVRQQHRDRVFIHLQWYTQSEHLIFTPPHTLLARVFSMPGPTSVAWIGARVSGWPRLIPISCGGRAVSCRGQILQSLHNQRIASTDVSHSTIEMIAQPHGVHFHTFDTLGFLCLLSLNSRNLCLTLSKLLPVLSPVLFPKIFLHLLQILNSPGKPLMVSLQLALVFGILRVLLSLPEHKLNISHHLDVVQLLGVILQLQICLFEEHIHRLQVLFEGFVPVELDLRLVGNEFHLLLNPLLLLLLTIILFLRRRHLLLARCNHLAGVAICSAG
mmetsp:Transcript_4437/g.7152  ORF Transcript_4437/g.7152 Transcript_4437/m.7152 type:complete len:326 (+) Transcript_4437:628-1605(+)